MTTSSTICSSEYDQALMQVNRGMADGSIVNYHLSSDQTRGRQIHVETEQGWDPHPAYVEFEEWVANPSPPN